MNKNCRHSTTEIPNKLIEKLNLAAITKGFTFLE